MLQLIVYIIENSGIEIVAIWYVSVFVKGCSRNDFVWRPQVSKASIFFKER